MATILIIDDDKRIRDIIKIQLHNQGYVIREAGCHSEAFQILGVEAVDLIICDIKMKDTDGLTVLKELKSSSLGDIPVIMLTGFINKEISDEAREEGCFDFITKPVKRQKLIEVIKAALADRI